MLWLMHNNLTGAIPRSMCAATYDEVYVGGNPLSCPRPCIRVGYGDWPPCPGACASCAQT